MIRIAITPGELLDRWSILHLKHERGRPEWRPALKDDQDELGRTLVATHPEFDHRTHYAQLLAVNAELWTLEERIHTPGISIEAAGALGLAIAATNGQRSAVKKQVDEELGVRPEFKNYAAPAS